MNFFKRLEKRLRWKRSAIKNMAGALETMREYLLQGQVRQWQLQSANPLNAFGAKAYSQSDEDGITLEILRRIGQEQGGVYGEFGVGDGTENNSLVLAALGWKGFWVGGQDLAVQVPPVEQQTFVYQKAWITLDNIVALARSGLKAVAADAPDVLSLDLDGNDIYFVKALLEAKMRPKLFIVEYNAKFPPPVPFQIAYDAHHQWQGDDYFGASLASFNSLFTRFGYRLVCCNSHTGSNAFFVDANFSDFFLDVPSDARALYVEPRYWLPKKSGHRASLKTIESILARRSGALRWGADSTEGHPGTTAARPVT